MDELLTTFGMQFEHCAGGILPFSALHLRQAITRFDGLLRTLRGNLNSHHRDKGIRCSMVKFSALPQYTQEHSFVLPIHQHPLLREFNKLDSEGISIAGSPSSCFNDNQ